MMNLTPLRYTYIELNQRKLCCDSLRNGDFVAKITAFEILTFTVACTLTIGANREQDKYLDSQAEC